MNGIYAEQWKKLRGIHRRLLLSFLIGPIGWLIIHFVFDPKNHHTRLVFIYMIVWVLFGAWTSYQFTHFSCPRCGRRWQGESFWQVVGPWHVLVLLHKCPHCGLELS
jgi:hypothetical protein